MRKIFLITLFTAIFISAYSQDKKIEFGLQAGYGYDMPKTTNDTILSTHGFHIGPILSYNIDETFGIQTGVLFNYYAATHVTVDLKAAQGNWNQYKTTARYLDIPIRFQYTVPLADELFLRLLAGPNLNFGLNRKLFYEEYAANALKTGYPKELKNYYENNPRYAPFDLQFGVGVAVQYNHISLRAGYDWGLLDRDKIADKSFKANDIKVGIAYTF